MFTQKSPLFLLPLCLVVFACGKSPAIPSADTSSPPTAAPKITDPLVESAANEVAKTYTELNNIVQRARVNFSKLVTQNQANLSFKIEIAKLNSIFSKNIEPLIESLPAIEKSQLEYLPANGNASFSSQPRLDRVAKARITPYAASKGLFDEYKGPANRREIRRLSEELVFSKPYRMAGLQRDIFLKIRPEFSSLLIEVSDCIIKLKSTKLSGQFEKEKNNTTEDLKLFGESLRKKLNSEEGKIAEIMAAQDQNFSIFIEANLDNFKKAKEAVKSGFATRAKEKESLADHEISTIFANSYRDFLVANKLNSILSDLSVLIGESHDLSQEAMQLLFGVKEKTTNLQEAAANSDLKIAAAEALKRTKFSLRELIRASESLMNEDKLTLNKSRDLITHHLAESLVLFDGNEPAWANVRSKRLFSSSKINEHFLKIEAAVKSEVEKSFATDWMSWTQKLKNQGTSREDLLQVRQIRDLAIEIENIQNLPKESRLSFLSNKVTTEDTNQKLEKEFSSELDSKKSSYIKVKVHRFELENLMESFFRLKRALVEQNSEAFYSNGYRSPYRGVLEVERKLESAYRQSSSEIEEEEVKIREIIVEYKMKNNDHSNFLTRFTYRHSSKTDERLNSFTAEASELARRQIRVSSQLYLEDFLGNDKVVRAVSELLIKIKNQAPYTKPN